MHDRKLYRAALAAFMVTGISGCGGGGDDPPRLSAATPAALPSTCEALATQWGTLPTGLTITGVTTVAAGTLKVAGQDIGEHCLVTGKVNERVSPVDGKTYAIGFEMRLPKAWNGRFWYQANGGIDGAVVTALGAYGGGPLTNALHQGFAVLSSDAGHNNAIHGGPAFGLDPQARLDYGYQAVGTLTPIAKDLIRRAYGKAPDPSYIGGCSNGGRHAMVAAARYADQYDGFLIGAPGFNLPKAAVANIFGAQRYALLATGDPATAAGLETAFTQAERATVSAAVLAKCDALDGASDGLIQDTTACQAAFNFMRDVPTCTGGRDGTCLSRLQKIVLEPIFSGAVKSDGTPIYAGFPFDSGLASAGVAFWEFNAPLILDSGAVAMIFGVPPVSPVGFNGPAFTLGADIDALVYSIQATNATYTESAMSFMTPPNPTDLSRVRNRGGKILAYHGVSDAIFSVHDTEHWYQGLQNRHGGDASDFARLFRVPGMGHCAGGPATDQFDLITPLVTWVEQGMAPERITATARGPGNAGGANPDVPTAWSPGRTRPLCPYPKVARYTGSGSLEDASNFRCE